jgi:predicted acylesterase/phospholipase RssA
MRLTVSRALALLGLAVSVTGCSALARNPVPAERTATAEIPGMPEIRAWAGRVSPVMERDLALSFEQESREEFPPGDDGVVRYPHLALSGGGANGAFGAGFLAGWTVTGRRPVFKIVSGVSTGALMAPFAFIGPSYDDALREFYTTTSSRDIFEIRSLLIRLLRGESFADTDALASLIARHVDEELLHQVADAHRRGRRLYMGTADLDSQNFVVWNMGRIAASDRPEALDLFRKVMLASASIPVAFPPVLFEVETDGRRYDELHVDGAVAANVFLHGGVFRPSVVRTRGGHGEGREDVFVIHNGQLRPESTPTRRSVRGIALRSLVVAGRSAVIGDLFRIYAFTLHEQARFQWVTIAKGVDLEGAELFDPVKMTELYDVGYRAALAGPVWLDQPPGMGDASAP